VVNFQSVIDKFIKEYLLPDVVMNESPENKCPLEENKKTSDKTKVVPEEYVGVEIDEPDCLKIVRNAETTECAYSAVCDAIGLQRSYKNKLKEKVKIRRQNNFGISQEPCTDSADLIIIANLLECHILIYETTDGIWRRVVIKPMDEIAERIRIRLIKVKIM